MLIKLANKDHSMRDGARNGAIVGGVLGGLGGLGAGIGAHYALNDLLNIGTKTFTTGLSLATLVPTKTHIKRPPLPWKALALISGLGALAGSATGAATGGVLNWRQ